MAETINLDQLDESLIEEVVEINPNLNPMDAPAPPDDGTYRVKLFPIESSEVEVKETNSSSPKPFIGFRFSGAIIAEGTPNNNKRLFSRVNTLVFDGKSEMAQYIKIIKGDTAEARQFVGGLTNYVSLAKAFKEALSGEPIIKIKTKWVAAAKDEKTGKYVTVKSGQKNFPPKKGGGFEHVVVDPKSGAEVVAQATIVDIFPDK